MPEIAFIQPSTMWACAALRKKRTAMPKQVKTNLVGLYYNVRTAMSSWMIIRMGVR